MNNGIGELIRRRRLDLGWTMEYLAARCEVNKSCISMWESGTTHPNAEKIPRLAEALGVEPSYFFEEEKPNGKFIENLKFLIAEKGISQKDFLSKMGLNVNAIGDWGKHGNFPNYAILEKIAVYFGVTVSELLGKEPTTREEETQMKTQAKPTIDEIIESMSEMGQVEWSYLRSAMDSKFTAPREVSDESREQHEKKLERLFNALCESVERISEGKIAAPDETKILPDLIRILKHWDND